MSGRELKKINPETKACIAYIAGRLISGSESASLYDYSRSKQINFSGNVTRSRVDLTMEFPEIRDDGWRIYSENASGSGDSIYLYLYNAPTMKHIELFISDKGYFNGYDLDPQRRFTGSVHDNKISLKDADFPDQYMYSINISTPSKSKRLWIWLNEKLRRRARVR